MALERFTNEYELQRIVSRCHTILWERQGLDPAQAFDEFSKLLYTRLYDELSTGDAETMIRANESAEAFARRVHALFVAANKAPGFSGIFADEEIAVDPLSVYQVFQELAPYSITATTAALDGADVKGTVYEQIIGTTFRGQLGQFFTHRTIVEFMVRMIGINEEKIVYDPACGSGGFLIMCAKVIREQLQHRHPAATTPVTDQKVRHYSKQRLFGTEINERTARVARLNFLLHGLDYTNIANENALKITDQDKIRARPFKHNTVDVVFANPPFAGFEKDPSVLSEYDLGRGPDGTIASVTREVLFIERIVRALRDGGEAGIVIPQGIFTNRNLAHVRDYLRAKTQILAVIELPDWAFIPSGTNVRGSLLFLRRRTNPPDDYHVFVKKVEHVGFTSTGRSTDANDFTETIRAFRSKDAQYLVPIGKMKNRIDAKFYIPSNRDIIKLFQKNPRHPLGRLSDIGTFEIEKVNPRATPEEIKLIETSAVDPHTLTITPKHLNGSKSNYTSARRVQAGDILISRRRTYRGAVVIVPKELEGALAITEFSVLRLHAGYDANYVVEILRSPQFVQLMTIYSTGEMSGRIGEKDLRNLAIPIPEDHHQMGTTLLRHRRRMRDLERRIIEERAHIEGLCQSVISGKALNTHRNHPSERQARQLESQES